MTDEQQVEEQTPQPVPPPLCIIPLDVWPPADPLPNNSALYIERESGEIVLVYGLDVWKPYGRWVAVIYSSGRVYGMPWAELHTYFEQKPNQHNWFNAIGLSQRPTKGQYNLLKRIVKACQEQLSRIVDDLTD